MVRLSEVRRKENMNDTSVSATVPKKHYDAVEKSGVLHVDLIRKAYEEAYEETRAKK